MNYVIWKNKDSRDIKGLIICELPPITKPQMRVAETVVDGVDGSIIEELGYSSYDKALTVGITQNADIDEILQYFSGSGEVVFSNEEDKYYKATIINQIDYARLVRFRTATVVFRVQPFKYEYLEKQAMLTEQEVSGTNIKIENGKIIKAIIEGEENATVKVTGKNELDYTKIINGSETTATQIQNGVNSQGTWYVLYPITLKNGVWSVSYGYELVSGTPTPATGMWRLMYANGAYSTLMQSGKSIEITEEIKGILFYSSNGTTTTSVNFTNIQLEKGATTEYEPYKEMILTADEILVQPLFDGVNNISNSENANMAITYVDNKMLVDNVGNCIAKPIMEIKGSGTIQVAVNGEQLFRYTFPENEDTVVIDSQKQDAYLGANLKNRNMSGEFPVFEIGKNTITWEGNISSIKISSKSRWL